MKPLQQQTSSYRYFVPSLRVEAQNVVTDRQTDNRHTGPVRNPRCACAPRVNDTYKYTHELATPYTQCSSVVSSRFKRASSIGNYA